MFLIFPLHIKKYLGQRRLGIFFTVGQNYACVGSGSISRLYSSFPQHLLATYVKNVASCALKDI